MDSIGRALQHLSRYVDEGEGMSWVHHNQPEPCHHSLQWKRPSSPSTKTFKVVSSADMIMLTVF